jgi:hypothetical protein
MASSSRKGGAGGKKSVTSRSTRKGRPAAKKAAPAGRKPRAKSTTGVIAVKRAGVLPRQSRARAPLPLAPEAGIPLEVTAALEASAPAEPTAVEPQPFDDAQPYAALEVVAQTETTVAKDVTDELPPAEPEPTSVALPAPPAPVPASSTRVSWLMTKLRRLAGLRMSRHGHRS